MHSMKRLTMQNGDVQDVQMCAKHEQRDGSPDPDCPDCGDPDA